LHGFTTGRSEAHDGSFDISRQLLGPTFAAIALGILINIGMYESMIAEALRPGILFYLSGLLSLLAVSRSSICTILGARTGASSSRYLAG
jgi:hypothetical protein